MSEADATVPATLHDEVRDPFRSAHEPKFACWCGTAAVVLPSGEGDGLSVKHRPDVGPGFRWREHGADEQPTIAPTIGAPAARLRRPDRPSD
jgi:hypothetical protein